MVINHNLKITGMISLLLYFLKTGLVFVPKTSVQIQAVLGCQFSVDVEAEHMR